LLTANGNKAEVFATFIRCGVMVVCVVISQFSSCFSVHCWRFLAVLPDFPSISLAISAQFL